MKIIINSLINIYYDENKDNVMFNKFIDLKRHVSAITREYNKITREIYETAKYDTKNKIIKINIGYGKEFLLSIFSINKEYYKTIEIIDERIDKDQVNTLVHKFEERDHLQKRSINKFIESKRNGCLVAPCGVGKTYIGLRLIEKIKKTTLIVVDEIMLLDQWKEDIINVCHFNIESLGEIGGGRKNYIDKDIIIATKQSLLNDEEMFNYLKEHISFIIVDECHTSPTNIFTQILEGLNPKYRLGLTATPERTDGFDFLMKANIGNIIDQINHREVQKIGSILEPIIEPIFIISKNNRLGIKNWDKKIKDGKKPMIVWRKLLNEVFLQEEIHHAIGDNIYKQYKEGRYSAVILSEIQWIERYYKYLTEVKNIPTDEIEIIKGDTEKDYRKDIIDKAKSGDIKIILTSKLLDKGVSINILDCIHLVYPSRNSGNIEQRAGRIIRKHPNKKVPVVFDYIFDNYVFFNQFYNKFNFSRYKAYIKFANTEKLKTFIKEVEKYFLSSTLQEREDERDKILNEEKKELNDKVIII